MSQQSQVAQRVELLHILLSQSLFSGTVRPKGKRGHHRKIRSRVWVVPYRRLEDLKQVLARIRGSQKYLRLILSLQDPREVSGIVLVIDQFLDGIFLKECECG